MNDKKIIPDRKFANLFGWIAVGISTVLSSLWAFWGIIENFHEGWYQETLIENLGLMFVQYLSPMIIFMLTTLVSIRWRKVGVGLHFLITLLAIGFFNAFSNAASFLIILPLVGIGLLYWFGSILNKKLAYMIAIGLPLMTLIISGIAPMIRVSQRINDGNLQAVKVSGNGVTLTWAPDGPGWPREGGDWHIAKQTCEYLSEDGSTLKDSPQYIWRLPTVDEAVRSMALHGKNSRGVWNSKTEEAIYEFIPDKEAPLWNVHSQVIYWWTATDIDQDRAYIIVYDGKVWQRSKDFGPAYLGFRCVQ